MPGTTWEEIISLCRLCEKEDKLVASHVRADVAGVFDAADELRPYGPGGKGESAVFPYRQYGRIRSDGAAFAEHREYRRQGEGGYALRLLSLQCVQYGNRRTTYDEGFLESYQSDYDSILIVNGKYAGQRCTKGNFDELRAQALDTATVGYFMRAEDVEMALLSPLVMLGSDGVRTDGLGHRELPEPLHGLSRITFEPAGSVSPKASER